MLSSYVAQAGLPLAIFLSPNAGIAVCHDTQLLEVWGEGGGGRSLARLYLQVQGSGFGNFVSRKPGIVRISHRPQLK